MCQCQCDVISWEWGRGVLLMSVYGRRVYTEWESRRERKTERVGSKGQADVCMGVSTLLTATTSSSFNGETLCQSVRVCLTAVRVQKLFTRSYSTFTFQSRTILKNEVLRSHLLGHLCGGPRR